MEEQSKHKLGNISATVSVFLTSIFLIALGLVMFSVKTTMFGPFCKLLSSIIVIIGLYSMISYFVKDQYKNTGNYGFVSGASILALGAIAFINSGNLVAVFPLILGYIILVLGLLLIQHTIDMKLLQKGPWALSLVFAVILFVCGIFVIVNPDSFVDTNFYSFCIILIIAGVFTIISTVCYMVSVMRFNKEGRINLDRNLEEDIFESDNDEKTEDSIVVENSEDE